MFYNYSTSVYVLFCSFILLLVIGFIITGRRFHQIPIDSNFDFPSDRDPKLQFGMFLAKAPKGVRWFYSFANQYWFLAIILMILLQGLFLSIFMRQASGIEGFSFWSSIASLISWGILATIPIANGIKVILLGANLYPKYLWAGKKQFVTGAKARFGAYCFIGLGLAIFMLIAFDLWLTFWYLQSIGM